MFEVLLSALVISLLTTIILYTFFRREVVWFEIVGLIALSLLSSSVYRWAVTSNMTKDYEYWGTRFERVEYYEEWDEWIEQTCSETCCCDAEGNNCQTTYYDCSYREYHPERFVKVDHLGNRFDISKQEYLRLKEKMANSSFRDLNRDYYRIDGDMYYTTWNRELKDYECITTQHTYENKTQAVPNVFNYQEVDSFDIATYNLFEYPTFTGRSMYFQKNILGYNDPKAEHMMQILNGELGHTKQVKTFILVFKDKPLQAASLQESYWNGGNKNEVVITINIDSTGKPTWCVPFSWSEKENFKIAIRDFVLEQDKLDLNAVAGFAFQEIKQKFVRKEFSDFDYLEVELSTSQMIWNIVISIIINVFTAFFIVANNIKDIVSDTRIRYRKFRTF